MSAQSIRRNEQGEVDWEAYYNLEDKDESPVEPTHADLAGMKGEAEAILEAHQAAPDGSWFKAVMHVAYMKARRIITFMCDDLDTTCDECLSGISYDDQGCFYEWGIHHCGVCCGWNGDDDCIVCDKDECAHWDEDKAQDPKRRRYICQCFK